MSEFVFLYRRPTQPPGSPEQQKATMQRWQAWFKDLEATGHLAAIGQPVGAGGAVVTNAKGSLRDGPYAETKDIVVGYSLIKAKDLEEAVALTKGGPIFEAGGVIEVRPVMKM